MTKIVKSKVKKGITKKATPQKKQVKKTVTKKSTTKKSTPKKAIVKKSPVAKTSTKKVPVKKKVVKKKLAIKTKPINSSLPKNSPTSEQHALLSEPAIIPIEILIEKVMNKDPLRAFDKHVFQKTTAKGDPHKRLRLNNKSKKAILPSNKKPLWRK
ncbi:MAG TPA: hypothetical protein PK987_01155 [Ferruginibacter sp.]|nr:hypothetical protein [Ferruginibacter sp.]